MINLLNINVIKKLDNYPHRMNLLLGITSSNVTVWIVCVWLLREKGGGGGYTWLHINILG